MADSHVFDCSRMDRKLASGIIVLIILVICLAGTTFALVYASVSVDNNIFKTGKVAINLNDGAPVIEETEFLFEPGMTVEKRFFIENVAKTDVWYRLYFQNVSGDLADALEVTIKNGAAVLYSGKISSLTYDAENPPLSTDTLLSQSEGKRYLTITFHFPEDGNNDLKNATLRFDLVADAVQAKNNELREFD